MHIHYLRMVLHLQFFYLPDDETAIFNHYMIRLRIFFGICLLLGVHTVAQSQNTEELQLIFPQEDNWNVVKEGEWLQFKLQAKGGLSKDYIFNMLSEIEEGISFDSLGNFAWTPGYGIVPAKEKEKNISFIFEVTNKGGESTSRQADIVVQQSDLLPDSLSALFEVNPGTENRFQIEIEEFTENVEFDYRPGTLPEGMEISKTGEVIWTPTETQVEQLKASPLSIDIRASNKEYKEQVFGKLEVVLVAEPETAQTAVPQPETTPDTVPAADPLKLVMPTTSGWNIFREGEAKTFTIRATGGAASQGYSFSILKGNLQGITFDTQGNFAWQPDYDLVGRLEERKAIQVIFEVKDNEGQSATKEVTFIVNHSNRFPVVKELPIFYVQYDVANTFRLGGYDAIYDEDGDPLVFKPVLSQMPQGLNLSGSGELTWKPSRSQFNRLREEPLMLPFIVEDQPHKDQTEGVIRIQASEVDLPPEISVIPNENEYAINEDETLNLKFYLSDPNGEEDILAFDFVSENSDVPKSALVKNDEIQYEFVWTPGYDFFTEPGETASFNIVFFVVDKTNHRSEKPITVTVKDAENLVEKDRLLYSQYRTGLVRVWELMEELQDKEKDLRKRYKKSKKGKQTRAITTASLGAVTGLSPVFLEDDTQKITSGIGGTASMTLGTLEASHVIGTTPSDVMEQLSYVVQKLNELQVQGDIFAAKYALSSSRRNKDFSTELKKLIELTNMKNLPKLGLDSNWSTNKKASDNNIKKTFKDFNPNEDYAVEE